VLGSARVRSQANHLGPPSQLSTSGFSPDAKADLRPVTGRAVLFEPRTIQAVAAVAGASVVSFQDEDVRILDVLADANDQFHWGTKPGELECAARRLTAAGVNADLAQALEAKAARMRTIKGLRLTARPKRPSRSRTCCARAPALART
jgi:hypothetical protein